MPRIRFKTGSLEFEVEGEEQFIEAKLKELPELMLELTGVSVLNSAQLQKTTGDISESFPTTATPREGTINTVMAALGGNSCREVLVAAAAHASIFQGKDRFSDEDWEQTAKQSNLWQAKWAKEKAKTKKRLIQSRYIIENAAGVYSLSPQARSELEAKLA